MGHITCLIVITVVLTILSQEVSTESKHGSPVTNQRLDKLRQRRLKFAERRKLKLQRFAGVIHGDPYTCNQLKCKKRQMCVHNPDKLITECVNKKVLRLRLKKERKSNRIASKKLRLQRKQRMMRRKGLNPEPKPAEKSLNNSTPKCFAENLRSTELQLRNWFESILRSHERNGRVQGVSHHRKMGCACAKSVMFEFDQLRQSSLRHLTRVDLQRLNWGERMPCVTPLLELCDANKDSRWSEEEWCCCFSTSAGTGKNKHEVATQQRKMAMAHHKVTTPNRHGARTHHKVATPIRRPITPNGRFATTHHKLATRDRHVATARRDQHHGTHRRPNEESILRRAMNYRRTHPQRRAQPAEGPCHKALRKLQATRLGASHGTTGHLVGGFSPRCSRDGFYDQIQCHGSTGYCWCSDRHGNEQRNTRVRGRPRC